MDQTIILDNAATSYMFQPDNGIPITTWMENPHDTELLDLIEPFRVIANSENVYEGIRRIGGIQNLPINRNLQMMQNNYNRMYPGYGYIQPQTTNQFQAYHQQQQHYQQMQQQQHHQPNNADHSYNYQHYQDHDQVEDDSQEEHLMPHEGESLEDQDREQQSAESYGRAESQVVTQPVNLQGSESYENEDNSPNVLVHSNTGFGIFFLCV